MKRSFLLSATILGLLALSFPVVAQELRVVEADVYQVGLASVDITPAHPVRLNGFGNRKAESEGVLHPIHAKAMVIEAGESPLVLVTVDILGIPAEIRAELAKRLKIKSERLVVTATHTHSAPMLKGANITMFGTAISAAEQKHIDGYTAFFLDKLQAVVETAMKRKQPSQLYWGIGSVGFAINRRAKGGPVDHDLPVLFVRDLQGKVRGVYVSYACHCVTLSANTINGDWAGFAQEAVETDFPNTVCLHSVGCGAENNPDSGVVGDKAEVAKAQGRVVAAEVKRLSAGFLAPIRGKLSARESLIDLAIAEHPTREQWQEKAKRKDAIGYHAQVQLQRLDAGEKLRTVIPYPMVVWQFGPSLDMVFMAGEVVADYSLQLKKEFDRTRLWINGYSNDAPCYIPSERVLKLGSYEGSGAMIYYDQPAAFAPGLEEKILRQARELIGKEFLNAFDPQKIGTSKPSSPQQSLTMLQTKPGFRVELMAAEPLVESPVAIAFGPDGRLWVAEMSDYPNGKAGRFEPGGRIRVLEDTRGTECFEKATVFVKDIPFPTGVLPWRKGVLICAAPDILYAECTNGSGVADKITKLYSGFGTDNYQARVNSLQYGLDGWVYGSCGLFGGDITCHRTGQVVKLGNRDFRIQPDLGTLEPATGRTQQGRVRDDWDNWFGCDNSNLGWHYPLPDHYLRRNPLTRYPHAAVAVPKDRRLFPAHGLQLFALSGPPGLATAACGIGIYRDDALGDAYAGNAFTCEPVNQVVTRMILKPEGSSFKGVRAKDEIASEFLEGTDPWFRPVQAITGPDGALWVVDMYRSVIEHPRWIPPQDLAKLDVRAGAGMGRLYRVIRGVPRPWPRLDRMTGDQLASALDNANGWQRDMAMQQILWRVDDKDAIMRLRELLTHPRPETRLQVLCTLDRLKLLTQAEVKTALADSHPGVRRHAVRLAVPFLNDTDTRRLLEAMAVDADPQLRLQLAFAMGGRIDFESTMALAKLARNQDDPYLVAAVASGLTEANIQTIFRLLGGKDAPAEIRRTIFTIAAISKNDSTLTHFVNQISQPGREPAIWTWEALAAFLEARERAGMKLETLPFAGGISLRKMQDAACGLALNTRATTSFRCAALNTLGWYSNGDDHDALLKLLSPNEPPELQSQALAALARIKESKLPKDLLARWETYTPAMRSQVLDLLMSRDAWLKALLEGMRSGQVSPGTLDTARRERLLHHPDPAIAALAVKLFETANPDRKKVIDAYQPALKLSGDAAKGKAIFAKTCAACHQLEKVGHAIGPDLAVLKTKTPAYLLGEILDPNRNLDSRYMQYTAILADGRSLIGLLASETATGILLKAVEGKEYSILRRDLEALKSSGKSLMPDGLETDLPPQAMADLIAYLTSIKP